MSNWREVMQIVQRARQHKMEGRHLALSAGPRTPSETPSAALLLARQRSVPQHLSESEPLRLPPVQDSFHNVGRQAGER
jgi:hypothetical protein